MNKRFFALGFLGLVSFTAVAQEIVFATGDWEPWSSKNMTDPKFGIASAMVEAICKEAGITPKFEFMPWARVEDVVAKGQVFAGFPYAATEERKAKYNFSDVIFSLVNKVFYHEDNEVIKGLSKEEMNKLNNFKSLADLKAYKFANLKGSFLADEYKNNKISFIESNDFISSLKLIKDGKRAQFLIDENTALRYVVKTKFNGDPKYKTLSNNFGEKKDNVLIISKTYKDSDVILKKFNDGLKKFKTNGGYAKFIKTHNIGS